MKADRQIRKAARESWKEKEMGENINNFRLSKCLWHPKPVPGACYLFSLIFTNGDCFTNRNFQGGKMRLSEATCMTMVTELTWDSKGSKE